MTSQLLWPIRWRTRQRWIDSIWRSSGSCPATRAPPASYSSRFLAGMSNEEAAAELGVSPRTVKRDWAFARAWLAAAIDGLGS